MSVADASKITHLQYTIETSSTACQTVTVMLMMCLKHLDLIIILPLNPNPKPKLDRGRSQDQPKQPHVAKKQKQTGYHMDGNSHKCTHTRARAHVHTDKRRRPQSGHRTAQRSSEPTGLRRPSSKFPSHFYIGTKVPVRSPSTAAAPCQRSVTMATHSDRPRSASTSGTASSDKIAVNVTEEASLKEIIKY